MIKERSYSLLDFISQTNYCFPGTGGSCTNQMKAGKPSLFDDALLKPPGSQYAIILYFN
jgi:hypothetical protein